MAQPPASLDALIRRYDAGVFEPPPEGLRVRLIASGAGEWDVTLKPGNAEIGAARGPAPEATLAADTGTWAEIAEDGRAGLLAFRQGRLIIRRNLNLGVALLAATSGVTGPGRLRFRQVETASGVLSVMEGGAGVPVILIHGLGATKGSFLPTLLGLSGAFRLIALDLPGFGDSTKPLLAPYHAPFFARAVAELMNSLHIDRAHVIGNSMGGRTALEVGLRYPKRVRRLVLLAPSLAWKRERPWAPLVRLLRPELSLIQLAPRPVIEGFVHRMIPGAETNWVRAGVDEFLRSYMTPRGRMAFYAAARQIYLEEPHGSKGFWTRLARLEPEALFIWEKRDTLVPIAFASHVRRALPPARHLELDCGHVPQMECTLETNAAIAEFLSAAPMDKTAARRPGRALGERRAYGEPGLTPPSQSP
ncbi:MAG: alpha/beta fold hydrolase [Deltaproteobacteria bacterium]|nr:alpha/beta fold hydrolase [Deltaproteobacteria bacterium]